MENSMVKVFDSGEFGELRTVNIEGDVWFYGIDVCKALGYENSRKAIADHIDDDDKTTASVRYSKTDPTPTLISESGMYSLIMSSKLPSAKKFKHWVTSEVLPSIRKTGSYSIVSADQQREAMKQQLMRELSIAPRKDACNALDEARHVSEKPKPLRGYCYGNFTNAIYRALFSMKASEIKSLLHVGKKHSLRDKLTAFELETVVKAEQKADELLRGTDGDRLTDAQLQRILEVLFPKIDIVKNHRLPEVCQ
jgi:prophage antirepressor-like protein